MANVYGLVTDVYKYGTGSLYAPYNTSVSKRFKINPAPNGSFDIGDNEDFYISVWIKYGSLNVAALGTSYPIIKYGYGDNTTGWEIGYKVGRAGDGYSPYAYFKFNNTTITTVFNGSNGGAFEPSSTQFDNYVIYRTNGVIKFEFKGSSNTTANPAPVAYTGAITKGIYGENSITLGSSQPVITSAGAVNGAWIDELFFTRGRSAPVLVKPNGEINDGATPQTVLLYHFNGDYLDDNSVREMAATTLTATTSIVKAFAINASQTNLKTTATITARTSKIARMSATSKTTLRSTATTVTNGFVLPGKEWPANYRSLLHLDSNFYDEITKTTMPAFGSGSVFATSPSSGFGSSWQGTGPYVTLDTFDPVIISTFDWDAFAIDLKVTKLANTQAGTASYRLIHYKQPTGVTNEFWHFELFLVLNDTSTGTATDYLSYSFSRYVGDSSALAGRTSFSNGGTAMARLWAQPSSTNFWSTPRTVRYYYDGSAVAPKISVDNGAYQIPSASANYAVYTTSSGYTSPLQVGANQQYFGGLNTMSVDEIRLVIGGAPYNAPITAPYKMISNGYVELKSTATVNTTVNRYKVATAALASTTAIATANTRLRSTPARLQATATILARIDDRVRSQTANLTTAFTVTARVSDRNPARVELAAATTATILARKLATPLTNLNVSTAQTATARKTASARANLVAFASEVTLDTAVKSAKATLQAQAQVIATPVKLTFAPTTISSSSSMVTTAQAVKRTTKLLEVVTGQTALAKKTARIALTLEALASELTLANYDVKSNQARLESRFTVDCNPFQIDSTTTLMPVRATLTALANYSVVSNYSDLNSQSTIYANGGKIRFGVAYLEAFASELVIGSKISIDPYLKLQIEQETGVYLIESEDRTYSIDTELRTYIVASENRLLGVNPENGVNIIQG